MKIYVCGFSHCGSTILRKVIGDHSLVDEVTYETSDPPEFKAAPHIVFKSGGLPEDKHKDCKVIVIIKNPWDVLGSMHRRFKERDDGRLVRAFHTYMEYLDYFRMPLPAHKVRYEDLFSGGLERVFDYLGLEYEGPKDRKSEFSLLEGQSDDLKGLAAYRTKQINTPFRNMTGNSARYLPRGLSKDISEHKTIRSAYNDYLYLAR